MRLPWNYAYVGVFSHPFFATTDKDGFFKIDGVPSGRYTLETFHPRTARVSKALATKEIVVERQKTVRVDLVVVPK
jgi:hypothetical protein